MPHARHAARCMDRRAPHPVHVHLAFSAATNVSMPSVDICFKLSTGLVPYFVRYRLSSALSRVQGNFEHAVHDPLDANSGQFFSRHVMQCVIFPSSGLEHPGHCFFGRKWPMHAPQSIPQGAIIRVSMGSTFITHHASHESPRTASC